MAKKLFKPGKVFLLSTGILMKNKMPCWPYVPRVPKPQRSLNYILEWRAITTVVYISVVFIFYSNKSKEVSLGWVITVKIELVNCFLFTRQYLLPYFEIGEYLCSLCIWCYTNYYENFQMQVLTSFIVASFILTHIVVLIFNISSIILIFYICH